MIWQLMKRDPAWRWVRYLALACVGMAGWGHFRYTRDDWQGLAELFLMINCLIVLIRGGMAELDTRFQATLPVTVRQVLLSRVLSLLALEWLPVLAGMFLLAALRDSEVHAVPLKLWSAITCVVVIVGCINIRRGSQTAGYFTAVLPPILLFSTLPRFSFLRDSITVSVLAVSGLIAAAVFLRTWQTVTGSFQFAPIAAPHAPPEEGRLPIARRHRTSAWIPALRTLSPWGIYWTLLLFVLELVDPTLPASMVFMMAFGWQIAWFGSRWLTTLPVSPRVLMAVVLLPPNLALAAGYLLALHLPPINRSHQRGVIFVRATQDSPEWSRSADTPGCRTPNVLPSSEFWVRSEAGHAPPIQAPWGETFQPSTTRAWGYDVYNPYAVGCENSQRFLDWQFGRASLAIYGQPLALDSHTRSYNPHEHVIRESFRTKIVWFGATIGFSMITALIVMIFYWHGWPPMARNLQRAKKYVLFICFYGLMILALSHHVDLAQWLSWTLPSGTAGAVACIFVLLGLLYVAIEWLFRRLEFTDRQATAAMGTRWR